MEVKILVAGGTCSGKSTLASCIANHTGYPVTSVGKCLWGYAKETNLPHTAEDLQSLGLELIAQLGNDGFLQWIISHSPNIQQEQSFIIDGVRQLGMYESVKKMFSKNVLVYCVCDKETRITRLMSRDGISKDDAERILSLPLEQSVISLELQADLVFQPENSVNDFLAKLDALMIKLS